MDSEVTGMALFSEGRSPEENGNYASHRRCIISACTSKRVHDIFDLYPTKELLKINEVNKIVQSRHQGTYYRSGTYCRSRVKSRLNNFCARKSLLWQIVTSDLGISKKYSEIDVTPYPFIFHSEIIFSHVTRSRPILARQI